MNFERERFLCLTQHLICMVYGGLENLHNIKPKCGKKSMVQVMVTYYTPLIWESEDSLF